MTSIAGALLAAAGGGLTDINLGLTVWTVVLFALFSAVLYKLGWKPILALIEEREKRIVEAVENASKAQDEAQALLVQQKEILREAGQQRETSPGPSGCACLAAHDVGMPEQGVGRDDFLAPRMRPAVLDPVHWRGNGGTDLRIPERFARQDREIPGAAVLS